MKDIEEPKTLEERVRFYYIFDCNKHGLAPDAEEFATARVDELSNSDLLAAISDRIEDMFRARGL